MNTFLWILQGILAAVFLMAGGMKLMMPKEKLKEQMGWVEEFTDTQVKAIGVAEVAAAVGLVLWWAIDVAAVLTPLSAGGLVLLMVGAVMTHLRRNELVPFGVMNSMLAVLALIVAIGRFGDL